MVARSTMLILLPALERIASILVCPRDLYYSNDSDRCESCAELCHQATVRKTASTCRRLCPVGETVITKSSQTLNNTPSVNNSTEKRLPHTHVDSQGTMYMACTLMALLIICCISAALLMSGRYLSCHCYKRKPLCLKCGRTENGEFEEVSPPKPYDGGTLRMQVLLEPGIEQDP